jgi:Calcineurin-like phosphoesterase
MYDQQYIPNVSVLSKSLIPSLNRKTRLPLPAISYLLFVLVLSATILSLSTLGNAQNAAAMSLPVAAQSTGFVFAAGGDIGANSRADAGLLAIPLTGASFFLALGDMDYDETPSDAAWCSYVKQRVGSSFPFELVTGNHEEGSASRPGPDGYIGNHAACLPDYFGSNPVIPGKPAYPANYYFDYPQANPLMRVIMISANLDFDGLKYNFNRSEQTNYNALAARIDEAQQAGLWVAVGVHKVCLTAGNKACEIGADLTNLLIEKKVDLVLHGHEHNYQRSKQIALGSLCPAVAPGSYNPNCIVDDGLDNTYTRGAGTLFLINGNVGRCCYTVQANDSEAGYFAKMVGVNGVNTTGFVVYTVSPSRIEARVVNTVGSWGDNFSIVSPLPTETPTATATLTETPTATPTETPTATPTQPLATGLYDNGDGDIRYSPGWTFYNGAGPGNNTLHYTNVLNAAASFAFSGDGVVLYRTLASNRGDMEVCIDGNCQTISNHDIGVRWNSPVSFTNLGSTTHTLTIRNLSTSYIDLDGVEILPPVTPLGAGLYQQNDPNLTYLGTWATYSGAGVNGDSLTYTNDPNAQVSFQMSGDALTLHRTRASNRGPFEVCIDATCQTLNNTTTALQWNVPHTFDNLGAGAHTIIIRNLSSNYIDLDAIEVGNTAAAFNEGNHDDQDSRFTFNGRWYAYNGSGPQHATLMYSNTPGDEIRFRVAGQAFHLYRTLSVMRGSMDVCIDTSPCVPVNNYSATLLWSVPVQFGNLGAGVHTVIIRNTSSSSQFYLDLDSIEVFNPIPTPSATPEAIPSATLTATATELPTEASTATETPTNTPAETATATETPLGG